MTKRGQGAALQEFAHHLSETGVVRDAALRMGISPETGKSYFQRIRKRLGSQAV